MSAQPPPPPPPQAGPPQAGPPHAEKSGLSGGAVISLLGAGLLLVFMLQNRQDVRVHFFFWHATLPLWFIILGSALAGAVVWLGFGVLRRHRRRKARRESRRG
jgi:uncharacterized integral membrane protein